MLTEVHKQALAAALRASSDPVVVNALTNRMDVQLAEWCNTPTSTDAWHEACDGKELFEASDLTKFDGLSAGKRDAWRLMLTFAPIDMTRNANRKAIVDVWGGTDSVGVLQKCLRKATNGELIFGGSTPTTGTVTATKLNFAGLISQSEVSDALNRF